ncbi:PHP domain-containing protein [Halobacillus sp. A5]|uniref:PHP domain-containing protein n=1 Tax=Halobacillus sp. A5 TaxID=2880263 RepID=UPI0020A6B03D|nr:PHP domain-containing protein [Halobacillus sp. A5]MCP3027645.1 PHP domain-containing protein [Halobacillus sp. A5]
MKIDFHTHANLSKTLAVTPEEFRRKIKEAKESGLDALALTEHFNAPNFGDIYDMLDTHFSYKHHYYDVDGIKVFPGIEIDVLETGHFLVVAERETIKSISLQLKEHTEENNFIKVSDLNQLLHGLNVIKIGAHPYRESTPWIHHNEETLASFDAFDINGKDLYKYGREMKEKVEALASKYDISAVGGSDTHQFFQYGAVVNIFPECHTIEDLRAVIKNKDYEVELSPSLRLKVKAAKFVKKLLKEKDIVTI